MQYVCTKCEKEKTPSEMSKDKKRRNGLSSWCKDCRKQSARGWGKSNPDKVKERYRLNKEKPVDTLRVRNYMLKVRYDLTLEGYDSLLQKQNYRCAICERDSKEMSYFLHVDHCHTTGRVRGLLCAPCNTFLGYSKDSTKVFENAINYLEESHGNQEIN